MADQKKFTIEIDGVEKAIDNIITLREELEKTFALREIEQGSIEQLKLLIKQLTEEYEALSEAEREVSGTDLITRIQMLHEKLSGLESASKNHLAIFGSLGETLNTISEGFENTNSVINSFSGILSSSSDILQLFGIESHTLTDTIEKLGAITKTVSTLQALHTQIVAKDSIVMQAAAVAKKLYTAATQGSSLALKGFRAAMISTGIGAFIALLGYLIANFDDIKKEIGNAVGGMDRFDAIMRKVEPVIAGVGNVLVQFLLAPIKQIVNAVTGLINVIDIFREQGVSGFSDAFEEIGNTAKKSVKIQKDSINIVKNFQEASDKSKVESAKAAARKKLEVDIASKDEHIKNMEAQNGANWKYTKDGVTAYESYFASCLAMYEKDSEEYKKIQRDKWIYDRETKEHNEGKPKKQTQSTKKAPDEYLKDIKDVQKETEAILKETEEKQIEHLKNLAANTSTKKAIGFIEQAAKKELAIQAKKNQQEKDTLVEHHQQMQEKYKGNTERIAEINESFAAQTKALDRKQAKEKSELTEKQDKELKEIQDKVNAASIKKEIEKNDKLIAAQNQLIEEQKKNTDKLNKDQIKRNGLGLIDIEATKANYAKAIEADKKYRTDLSISHMAKMILLKEELDLAKSNSEAEKEIKAKMAAENKNYANESLAVNNRINDNEKLSKNIRIKYFEELHAKMTEVWGKINEGLTSAFQIANSIMKQQIDEAKEKLGEVTKQYDAVVEKRKESQDKIKSLEEEASSASGGRAIVIQEQIARQMEANAELAQQEQNLAKQKEKLEKDIAKKEKQAKKTELGQKLIEGIANTALAVTKALATGPFIGQILAGIAAVAGAVQTAIIARQMSKLEDGGLLQGKRHTQGGMRIEGTNIEVEGDEFVVNRISTRKNLGLIDYINKQRRELSPDDLNIYFARSGKNNPQQHTIKQMYEQGGQLTNLEVIDSATAPDSNKILEAISRINFQPVVSVVDIVNTQSNITQVKDIAGI